MWITEYYYFTEDICFFPYFVFIQLFEGIQQDNENPQNTIDIGNSKTLFLKGLVDDSIIFLIIKGKVLKLFFSINLDLILFILSLINFYVEKNQIRDLKFYMSSSCH